MIFDPLMISGLLTMVSGLLTILSLVMRTGQSK
jgi:hypothetical protein